MADKKEEEQKMAEKVAEAAAQGAKKKTNYVFWGIVAGILILEFPIMFITINLTRPKSQQEVEKLKAADSLRVASEHQTEMGETSEKEPIEAVVNIAGTDGERFLKVIVIFEYDKQRYEKLDLELAKRKPKFKNMLIDLLSKMTLIELNEPGAKEAIRKGYLQMVNTILPPNIGQVSDVLLDQFIIQ